MKNKPIIIVSGEPYSVFLEIFFKVFKSNLINNYKRPIILIASEKLVKKQMKKLNFSFKINLIKKDQVGKVHINNKYINLININFSFTKTFDKISNKSNKYIEDCFNLGLKIIKKNKSIVLINGPISKENFLKKKFPGITEYVAKKTNSKNPVMLIYNKKLAVSPLSTHIPINKVSKFMNLGTHGSTFGGNPLAISIGNEVLEIIKKKKFLKKIDDISRYLWHELLRLQNKYDEIVEVRGAGLLLGIKTKSLNSKILKFSASL